MSVVKFENARIMYKNFAGREGMYNDEGDRNFHVIIDDAELAEALKNEGWNVKVRPPRDENDTPFYHLPVKVQYGKYPPKVHLVTKKGVDFKGEPVFNVRLLDAETVGLVDDTDFENIDLIIRPYTYTDKRTGEERISAYLNEFWGLIRENQFANKYSNNNEVDDGILPFGM